LTTCKLHLLILTETFLFSVGTDVGAFEYPGGIATDFFVRNVYVANTLHPAYRDGK